ncbi:MAG TPA: ATPase domain-containing protein [Candidatus Dormibacteraeota bacterium]|jgi:recombination protein RecA|nr:ATPase domain-containing protein [Candidatus Dormibacteraeota bacterium]
MGQIQTRFGTAALQNAAAVVALQSDIAPTPRPADVSSAAGCPTGIAEIDDLTSVGGLPRGRLSLCLGSPGAGKMMVGYQFLAQASQEYAAVLALDMRGHLDPWLMARMGARLDRVLVLRPDRGAGVEDELKTSLEATLALLRAGVGCVLADLPAAWATSGLWDPFAASLSAACSRAGAPMLLLAEDVAAMPLRYAASVVLRLRHQEWLLRHGDIDGVRLSVVVEKNKVGMPGGAAEFVVRYPRGTFMPPP